MEIHTASRSVSFRGASEATPVAGADAFAVSVRCVPSRFDQVSDTSNVSIVGGSTSIAGRRSVDKLAVSKLGWATNLPADCFTARGLGPLACRPACRQDLGLLQNGLHGGVLKVRRIAILAESALSIRSGLAHAASRCGRRRLLLSRHLLRVRGRRQGPPGFGPPRPVAGFSEGEPRVRGDESSGVRDAAASPTACPHSRASRPRIPQDLQLFCSRRERRRETRQFHLFPTVARTSSSMRSPMLAMKPSHTGPMTEATNDQHQHYAIRLYPGAARNRSVPSSKKSHTSYYRPIARPDSASYAVTSMDSVLAERLDETMRPGPLQRTSRAAGATDSVCGKECGSLGIIFRVYI